MKKIIILILFAINFSYLTAIEIPKSKVSETLNLLDQEIANREKYINKRQTKIDSIKKLQKNTSSIKRWLELNTEIGTEYIAFDNDSAISYFYKGYSKAIEHNLDSLKLINKLKYATYLPLAGFITEAQIEYESIDSTKIPKPLKELYYESGKQLYSYIYTFYKGFPNINKKWEEKSNDAHINLINNLSHDSDKYKVNIGELYLDNNELTKAKAILEEAINTIDITDNLYARATHALAIIANRQNNENEYIYYLALSSISDVKSATLEVVSIQELSSKLINLGDIQRSYKYVSVAQENAVACNARIRMVEAAEVMAIIEEAHSAESQKWSSKVKYITISITMLALFLTFALIYLYRDTKRLNKMRNNLKIANDTKEVYISQFLSLCSIYMDKLTQFNNIVNRKLSAGKADDLYKITKSGKFIEEQSKEFYDVFDNAFLNIYPTFIDDVNKLLTKEEQITLTDEKLNTDLRILALMRLGIDDSSKIAQMLNYSINTIYAYRNKLKNKAINRDTFESDLMKIKSIG